MSFDNWKVTKIYRAKTGIGGLNVPRETGDDAPISLRLLLVDDELGRDECQIREQYFPYLANVEGKPLLADHIQVHIFHTESFPLGKEVIEDFERYDIDGALLDLKDDSTGEWAGKQNLSQVRNLDLSPPLGTLVLSQYIGSSLDVAQNVEHFTQNSNYAFASRKAPYHERRPEEFEPLQQYFEYLATRRHYLNQPWGREFARFVGTKTRNRVLDFIQLLRNDTQRKMPIVILGETGTGKELVARMIHAQERWADLARADAIKNNNAGRRNAPTNRQPTDSDVERWLGNYVPVLVGAIPEGTLESDLFGIEKHQGMDGTTVVGYCRAAAGGTLFLDEVGDLPLQIQGKLLRFLQEDMVHPVGADKWEKVDDVRKVFATNRDLVAMCERGEMREDFLHRIDGLTIRLPTLAERVDDHGELIDHFIRGSGYTVRSGRPVEEAMEPGVRDDIMRMCASGALTGNVRQLERFLNRLALVAGNEVIGRTVCEDVIGKFSLLAPMSADARMT